MAQRSSAAVVRRAPRLGPEDRIAPHMSPSGRFAKIDPLVARPVPPLARIVGVVGWAVLTVESIRRARARVGGAHRVEP